MLGKNMRQRVSVISERFKEKLTTSFAFIVKEQDVGVHKILLSRFNFDFDVLDETLGEFPTLFL